MASNASVTINGLTLTKQSLELACKDSRCTLRQLARALAEDIGLLAEKFEWPGNKTK
jgi:hypothetical protein